MRLLALLLWLFAAPALAQQVPFTLPTAGNAGFEKGVKVCFKDIGSAGFSLTTPTGSLRGIPTSGGIGTVAPGGNACATSDPPNWDVETAQPGTVAPDRPYDIEIFWPGVPPNNAIVRAAFTRGVTCAQNLPGSVANSRVAATGSTTITINQIVSGTGSSVGTVVFAPAATTATFTAGSTINFAAGNDVEFAFPAVADATLADIAISLQCTRS